ncbi:MAG: glycosyltransferase [Bacteroidetes bacterium]|nr:glycosyltransferase [Bacteroidota bacterium]
MHTKFPKISIIVPVYNSENFIAKCIHSILNQSFKEIEVIAINDCSTDQSQKILEDLAAKDNRLRIINNKTNIGGGGSRNIGISSAKGTYLMFVDHDDWLNLDACEVLYNIAYSNDLDILEATHIHDSKSSGINTRTLEKQIETPKVYSGAEYISKYPFNPIIWNRIWKRAFMIENQIYCLSGNQFSDSTLSIQGLIYAKRISKIEFPFYHYFKGNKFSVMNKPINDESLIDKLILSDFYLNLYRDNDSSELDGPIRKVISGRIQTHLSYLRRYQGKNKDLQEKYIAKMEEFIRIGQPYFMTLKQIPYLKKLLIYLSPSTYITVFRFIDKIKSRLNKVVLKKHIKTVQY